MARTLCRSGDCCRERDGDDGGILMDIGVRGGRKNGWVCKDKDLSFCYQILLPVDFREEGKSGVQEGLEEIGWDASLKELPELSQHEELQDFKPHGSKAV